MDLENKLWVLASGIRLRILARLTQQPAQVRDLTSELHSSQPTISRHLKYLQSAGFVTRQSRSMAYTICPGQVEQVIHQLESRISEK